MGYLTDKVEPLDTTKLNPGMSFVTGRNAGIAQAQADREQQIQVGLNTAMQEGGYEGALDYLKFADPQKALEMSRQKAALDTAIMQNNVIRDLAPVEHGKAMAESYDVLGKLGAGIIQAAPQERDHLYQLVKPALKQIDPSMPDRYDGSIEDKIGLGIAQSMPASVLLKGQKDVISSESMLGKLDLDIKSRERAGIKAETDPGLRALYAQRDQEVLGLASKAADYRTKQAKLDPDSIATRKQQYQYASSINDDIQKIGKDYIGKLDVVTQGLNLADDAAKGNTQAQTQLAVLVARMFQSGAMSNRDVENAGTGAVGLSKAQMLLKAWGSGQNVAANAQDIMNIRVLLGNVGKTALTNMKNVEDQFKPTIESSVQPDQLGRSVLRPEDIRLPSTRFERLLTPEGRANVKMLKDQEKTQEKDLAGFEALLKSVPPEIQQMASDALQRGATPQAVQQRLMQLIQQQQSGGGQPQNGQ